MTGTIHGTDSLEVKPKMKSDVGMNKLAIRPISSLASGASSWPPALARSERGWK